MNDTADKPSEATAAEPEFRKISDEELQCILENHQKWLAAEDKTGLDHLRADLSLVDLRGHDAILSGAQLQGAVLDLARLEGVDLIGARLQAAELFGTRLQTAKLGEAQLQGAWLRGAQLQGARLYKAQLHGAILEDAILEGASLTDADFRDADLSNAQLSTVTGLRAEMLAGAVLTNAKLPDDIKTFDQLKHVEEISRNSSRVFFGLLAASLYSWLTIATTTDVALITGTASSPLPIINTNIALSGFYLAAPLILIAVYFYFHLYLQRLWGDLATLPAVFPDGAALDRKAYPWLPNGLVRAHFKNLQLAQRPLTSVENAVSIFHAWWVVPFTLLAFWFRFLPLHDWRVTALHVAIVAVATGFGVASYRLAARTLSGQALGTAPSVRLWARALGVIRRYRPDWVCSTLLALMLVLSLSAAVYPADPNRGAGPRLHLLERPPRIAAYLFSALGYRAYADLTDDDVSAKPSGSTGREETAAVEIAQVKGADLEGRDLRHANARFAFLAKAKLRRADLRRADLLGANLSHADLSSTDLSRAYLYDANLSGARLTGANLSGANLSRADLSGADLSIANLSGADLSDASLREAHLLRAAINDAYLGGANLSGADLSGADLSGAELSGANLSGAALRSAKLIGASFRQDEASLSGASVRHGEANLSGADLSGADLRGAGLGRPALGARARLTQAQLDRACGDDRTQLPRGLTIKTCPVAAPPASPSPPPGSF